MTSLTPSFLKAQRLGLSSVLAAVALAGAAVPAHAQDAPPADTSETAAQPARTATAPRPVQTNNEGGTTTVDPISCMQTTTTQKTNGGFLGIIGNSRRSSTTSTYSEQCGDDRVAEATAFTMMLAVRADGSPDIPMRAMGLQLYRQRDDESRQRVDAMLAANDMSAEKVVLSLTPTGSAAVCVREAAPAATAGTPVRVSVSFRCTQPGATTPQAAQPAAEQPAPAQPASSGGVAAPRM